jgi:uncharacterized protein YjbI with pentapeptide repeats
MVAAPAAFAGEPFIHLQATLGHDGDDAVVTGNVEWNEEAVDGRDHMTEGDLRLVAVSEDGHHPTVLATETYAGIAKDPTRPVDLRIKHEDEDAIRGGNRVVLTASQHGAISDLARTERTYVTVDQLQAFGRKQDRIGRRDCADLAIFPGAILNECDLVGADLDRALVSEREPAGRVTRMIAADLTGATAHGADLTGLSVAGGRLNGADLARANLTNVSLAKAEGTGLDAEGTIGDRVGGSGAANIFDARLVGANFKGAVLPGVSLSRSDLDRADFTGSTWLGVEASAATFRGADLSDLQGTGGRVELADFTDAKLLGAPFKPVDLEWATLCHTLMPGGRPDPLEDRDCPAKVDPGPMPVDAPLVVVTGSLKRAGGEATIEGTVKWSAAGIAKGLTAGDVRAVAIDARTGEATPAGSQAIAALTGPSRFEAQVAGKELAALDAGNRVVLTATQHGPTGSGKEPLVTASYVSVDTLQPGPGRGRVGSRDCADVTFGSSGPAAPNYDFCDLPGAVLNRAALSGSSMRDVDLSGAELRGAALESVKFDGAAMGGADLTGAKLRKNSLVLVRAPGLTLPRTVLDEAEAVGADLDGANFEEARIGESIFATASLRGARFSEAIFGHDDLAYTDLGGAKLDGVDAASEPGEPRNYNSLFLADLTGATLADSHWDTDETGEVPWRWSILCGTAMPPGATEGGDRDCPR